MKALRKGSKKALRSERGKLSEVREEISERWEGKALRSAMGKLK